jgi:hypothetical protein
MTARAILSLITGFAESQADFPDITSYAAGLTSRTYCGVCDAGVKELEEARFVENKATPTD